MQGACIDLKNHIFLYSSFQIVPKSMESSDHHGTMSKEQAYDGIKAA